MEKVLLYGDPGVFTVIVEHLPITLFVRVELALAVQLIVHFLLRDGKAPAFRLFQHCKIAQPPVQRLRITGCRSALHDGHDLLFVVDPALPDLRAFERRNDRIVVLPDASAYACPMSAFAYGCGWRKYKFQARPEAGPQQG